MYYIVVQVQNCRENSAPARESAAAFYPNKDVPENADHSILFFSEGPQILLHVPSNKSTIWRQAIHRIVTWGLPWRRIAALNYFEQLKS